MLTKSYNTQTNHSGEKCTSVTIFMVIGITSYRYNFIGYREYRNWLRSLLNEKSTKITTLNKKKVHLEHKQAYAFNYLHELGNGLWFASIMGVIPGSRFVKEYTIEPISFIEALRVIETANNRDGIDIRCLTSPTKIIPYEEDLPIKLALSYEYE